MHHAIPGEVGRNSTFIATVEEKERPLYKKGGNLLLGKTCTLETELVITIFLKNYLKFVLKQVILVEHT